MQKPTAEKEIKRIDCNRRCTFPGSGVECKSCKNWFHAKCQGIFDTVCKNVQEIVSICSYCKENGTTDDTQKLKNFSRFAVT